MSIPKMTPDTPGYLPPEKRPVCRGCGETLRAYTRFDTKTEVRQTEDGSQVWCVPGFHNFRVAGWGYRGDGLFCTAGCGYAFACRVVRGREGS